MRRVLTRHRVSLAVAALGIAIAVVTLLFNRPLPPPEEPSPPPPEEPAVDEEPVDEDPEALRMPLTGVPTDEVPERPALLVKVSNSTEARPQTGLDHADVVFEELTEGGVTRFIAVFHSDLPEVVGPVRSARPVDTQVMAGFGRPGFAYSGARGEVRDLLARTPAVAITEGAPGFFRDSGTYASHPVAPHNLFLRVEPALAAVIDGGALPIDDIGWVFDEEPPEVASPAEDGTSIVIAMSTWYRTSWSYDVDAGLYHRAQDGEPFEVTGPGRVAAANVIVLEVDHYIGESGYPETDVLGDGEAIVLRDGQRYPARWSKPTETDPLLILTADGQEPFPLKPGPTWLHLPDTLPE